ncbi:MAG: hypothetical protein ACE5GS_10440 [Kiloniellaceae bacterium]
MTDHWYNAFSTARAEGRRPEAPATLTSDEAPSRVQVCPQAPGAAGGVTPAPEQPEADTPAAALIKLQSLELQRLARENERLMDRIDTLLQLQEREQVLRQQLQTRIDRLSEPVGKIDSATERETLCREIREGLAEEIKPIFLAIVELLELAVSQPETGAQPTDSAAREPLPGEEFQALPEILTRPLEELTAPGPDHDGNGAKSVGNGEPARGLFKRGRSDAAERAGSAGPGTFPWTTVFS